MDKILDDQGNLLNKPSTVNHVGDSDMSDEEKNMPGTPPESRSSEDEIANAQVPRESRETRDSKPSRPSRCERSHGGQTKPRKRPRSDEKTALEMSVRKSEESLIKIEEHLSNNTCPKTLRYSARAKIRPDAEFKTDINRIRKEAERKMLAALKKFHHRSVKRNKVKLRELERKSRSNNQPSTSTNTDVKRHRASRQTNVTPDVTNVQRSANNIQKQIDCLKQMMEKLDKANQNKEGKSYPCLLSECTVKVKRDKDIEKRKKLNKKHNTRGKIARQRRQKITHQSNKRHIKNLSDIQLTTDQTSVLAKGLRFIPTPVTKENSIRHQLMRDFNQFARRMRLQYIYHSENNEPHPFHVKTNWEPPAQQSVALETHLEEVRLQLAETEISKPKNNLPCNEFKAIRELKDNREINIKKADKGSTTVIMNKTDKITEGQIQLDDEENYRPLATPMVEETRVERLITELHRNNHIDTMTRKWLSQTTNAPHIPEFLHSHKDSQSKTSR